MQSFKLQFIHFEEYASIISNFRLQMHEVTHFDYHRLNLYFLHSPRVPAIVSLGISASKFSEIQTGKSGIQRLDSFLTSVARLSEDQPCTSSATEDDDCGQEQHVDATPSSTCIITQASQNEDEVGSKEPRVVKKYGIQAFFTPRKEQSVEVYDKSPSAADGKNRGRVISGKIQGTEKSESCGRLKKGSSKKKTWGFFGDYFQRMRETGECYDDCNADPGYRETNNSELKRNKSVSCTMENTQSSENHNIVNHSEASSARDSRPPSEGGLVTKHEKETTVEPQQTRPLHFVEYNPGISTGVDSEQADACNPPSEQLDMTSDHTPDPSLSSDTTACEKCNKVISSWDYPEHLDYHFALELQKQMRSSESMPNNQAVSTANEPKDSGSGTGGGVKRRSKSHGSLEGSKKPRTELSPGTLHSFFKKK